MESISRLCELIGNPQDKLRFIHVAGTNGKGSTSAMLASVLHAAGYKTGLFLSPYMDDYCDSIQINGVFMSHDEFAGAVSAVKEQVEKLAQNGEHATEFEILTAIAFLWFYQSGCDIAVLEAGLGGRLDATNIIKNPLVSVITAISFDHMAYLGNTIEEIAREKCGIIKPGGVTVSYPLQYEGALAVIKEYASKKNNLLLIPDADAVDIEKAGLNGTDISYKGSKFHIPLSGRHQIYNALSAVEAIFALCDFFGFAISRSDIKKGIENTVIPARQEVLCRHPLIIL
ncbi:MAG: Mur ligase family protein, partial [Bacillota bacterium]|nr:Mur ligase family protein [Bacillota bacterium]